MTLLKRHGLFADKGFGQHFLISESVVSKIVASVSDCASVVEIGPGPGVLTRPLTRSGRPLIAIELDTRLRDILQESAPEAELIWDDALKCNLPAVLDRLPRPIGIVSNMPYYITGPLLERIEDVSDRIEVAVLMMQKEVGLRILSRAGDSDRGALSVAMQNGFRVERIAVAPAGAFLPPPKVDSVVLGFHPKGIEISERRLLRKLLAISFAQRRKTLENNLSAGFRMAKSDVNAKLLESSVDGQLRPQALTQEQWLTVLSCFRDRLREG